MDAIVFRLLGMVPAEENLDPNVLQGVSGSPGSYTGTARVVRSLAEAMDLEEGEVMVCEMTLPPWVPLFSIAGAVVSDVGGVLSHCAIVAREFNLPAVVGSQVGTAVIKIGPDHHRRRHQGPRLPRRPRGLPRSSTAVRAREAPHSEQRSGRADYGQSCLVARAAPSARARNLGQTTVGCTSGA